jgi:hypothetical protein
MYDRSMVPHGLLRFILADADGHWRWIGPTDVRNRPITKDGIRASRALFIAQYEELTYGDRLHRTCDKLGCVNPEHHEKTIRTVNNCGVCGVLVDGRLRRGMCEEHYRRWLKYGDPMWKPPPNGKLTRDEMLTLYILKQDDGCWLWTGPLNSARYGSHRMVYEHFVGQIPDKMELDHACRVRACVNPRHLEPVTRPENLIRGFRARTACRGKIKHDLTLENAFIGDTGRCRACQEARDTAFLVWNQAGRPKKTRNS